MKTLEIGQASAPLSEYVKNAGKEHLLLTDAGKPVALLIPIKNTAIPAGATDLYCAKGRCLVGYVQRGSDKVHHLYRLDGSIISGRATIPCECGAGREWY